MARDYSLEDLQQVVDTYNPDYFKAPLIVSAPAHNTNGFSDGELWKSQLAFGFPETLKLVGNKLFAGFKTLSPKIPEWVREGAILGFSASLYPPLNPFNPYPGNWSLRHVAGCGADPPSIKGQTPPELAEPLANFANYAEDQDGTLEYGIDADSKILEQARLGVKVFKALQAVASSTASFMDGSSTMLVSLFREFYQRQRDRFIETEGVEEADKIYPAYILDQLSSISFLPQPIYATYEDVERLHRRIDELIAEPKPYAYQEHPAEPEEEPVPENWESQFSELKSQVKTLQTQVDNLKTENAFLVKENDRIAAEKERDRITSFVEKQIAERRVLPRDKDKEVRFILSLDHTTTADYGEEGDLTPRQAYMNKLAAAKELWSDKRLPIGPDDEPDSASFSEQDIAFKARELVGSMAKQGITLSYTEAVNRVMAEKN
jgi:hypothetical protein